MFSHRLIQPELLDHLPPEEARPNLEDLRRINRRFGGHSTVLKAVTRATGSNRAFTLLDIGAASGDTARAIQSAFPASQITSLDYSSTNVAAAPCPKVIADAFQLPFGKDSFDYVLCTLFLHHFEDDRVVELLRSFNYVARKGVVVVDLERNVVPYLFLPLTRRLFQWRFITVHDGMRSVRASFKEIEMKTLGLRAGFRTVETQSYRPAFRISLIARK